MKASKFILFIVFTCCFLTNQTNLYSIKQPENENVDDFSRFVNLFPDLILPVDNQKLPVLKTIIPKELAEKFILNQDSEAKKADEIKVVGKIKYSDNYIGVIYSFTTNTSGTVHQMFLFNKNGAFLSELCIAVDFGSYQQNYKIDKNLVITIDSTTEENRENVETKYYIIKDGKFIEKK